MFGRAIITREFPTFLLFVAVISLATAFITIVARPQTREDTSESSASVSNSLSSVDSQLSPAGPSQLTSTGFEIFELRVGVEPPAGGAVILTPLSFPVADLSKGQFPAISDSASEPTTDSVTLRRYPEGLQVKLEAVPKEGFLFSRWNRGCVGARLNVCILTIAKNIDAAAEFVEAPAAKSSSGY